MNRDNFTKNTTEVLAKRVSYMCSNPSCKRVTVGSNENIDKATLIGIAAHITAASPGGPRYDASLSPQERRHIENGIWLCSNCATLIDRDKDKYPVELLHLWKETAERESAKHLNGEIYTKPKQAPLLEADLIWTTKLRLNTGYSLKNPVTMHNGMQVMDVTNHPIVYWRLVWNYAFTIYNNSPFPAYDIRIESVGDSHFTKLDALPKRNNLPPLQSIDLQAKCEDFIESDHREADERLKGELPKNLKNIKLKLSYFDDNRDSHSTIVEFSEENITNQKG